MVYVMPLLDSCLTHRLTAQSAPLASNIMKHPELAATFEAVADHGHAGYYQGRIAQGRSNTALLITVLLNSKRSWTSSSHKEV
jgi:hypothetical protein